jgi:hypothetical protein
MGDYRKGFIAGYKEAIKELKDCLKENTKGLKLSEEMKNVFIFSYNDILEIIDELILSKINSVSTQELKQTRGGELKSDEGLHSTEYGFPADTSFLGGYAEFWDNKEDDKWDKEEITGGEE